MSPVSLMMSLQTLLSPELAEGLDSRFGFRFGAVGYVATVAGGRLMVDRGDPTNCAVTFTGSSKDVTAVVHGGAPLEMIDVEGDLDLARRFKMLFPLPPKLA
jgi:hypothetical protein